MQTYINDRVAEDFSRNIKWAEQLEGSYAFGILSRNKEGNRILEVVRGTSMLYEMDIAEIGKVFTTNDDDAKKVVKAMGLTFVKEPSLMTYESMKRFDAMTGEQLNEEKTLVKRTYSGSYGTSYYYNGVQRHSSSHYGRNGSSSSSTTTKTTQTEETQTSMEEIIDAPVEDNLYTKKGKLDSAKVSKYCNNKQEPIEDRLDIYDELHNTDFLEHYECLSFEFKEYIKEVDETEPFKEVRFAIAQLSQQVFGKSS